MTYEMKKEWARENNKVDAIAELVHAGYEFNDAFEIVYDGATLSKAEFIAKYFG